MTTRLGVRKSSSALPWARNSGFVKIRAGSPPAQRTTWSFEPAGSVLRMTMGTPAWTSGRDASRALCSCPRSLRPFSRTGVPTQTRITSDAPGGICATGFTRARVAGTAKAASMPGSWMGNSPARRASRRSFRTSTRSMAWPFDASPIAVARPT